MNYNPNDASDPQGRETEPRHARPINPFFSGRLGRLTGIGTSSPLRYAGAAGEIAVFPILFAILISTLIGSMTQNLFIGIVSFVVLIAIGVGISLLFTKVSKSRKNQP